MNIRRGEVHEVVSFYSFLQQPVDVVRSPSPASAIATSRRS
jgi:hypothetical protein